MVERGRMVAGVCCAVTIVALGLILFFFWPRPVEGCIDQDNIGQPVFSFNTAGPTFEVTQRIPFRVGNENYFNIELAEINVDAQYAGLVIASGKITDFEAISRSDTHDTLVVSTTPEASSSLAVTQQLNTDCLNTFTYTVKYEIKVKLKIGGVEFTFSRDQQLPCSVVSNTGNSTRYTCQRSSVL
ncbi:hypothetical protein AAMO2058_001722700 [Amorphochlora amoebiformis]